MLKSICLSLLAFFVAFSCVIGNDSVSAVAEQKADSAKEIDVYLIGGQSNASGYSAINGNPVETFENVGYAGITEVPFRRGNGESISTTALDYENIKWSVTGGMGKDGGNIGPEYGMAKVLNEVYIGNKKALIFKTAAGGTSLLDKISDLSEKYGNWYPRSLWEDGYDPDITKDIVGNDATGLLYKFFVENLRKVYNELVENGYKPAIKAMVWMQGETDIYGDYEQYGDTLKTFISDIRNDIYDITADEKTKAMPFVIGKIASSFKEYNNSLVKTLQLQQDRVAREMSGVATISTDDLIINSQDGTVKGTDIHHFNFNDAVTLGTRFAEKALEISDLRYVVCNAKGGNISYAIDEENYDKITFRLTPDKHYKLKSFTVNGNDYTDSVEDNCATVISNVKQTTATAVFEEKEKYAVEYADIGKAGGFQFLPKIVHEGEILSLKLWLNEGYEAEKVTFGDSEMTYNPETRCYEITVNAPGKVSVQLKTVKEEEQPSDTAETEKEGCSGALSASGVAATAVAALAIALFVKNGDIEKKKK